MGILILMKYLIAVLDRDPREFVQLGRTVRLHLRVALDDEVHGSMQGFRWLLVVREERVRGEGRVGGGG